MPVAAVLLLALGLGTTGADRATLRVRASEGLRAVPRSGADTFSRQSSVSVVVDVGGPDPPRGADVVVGRLGDDAATRVGAADLATSFDLSRCPGSQSCPKARRRERSAVAPDRWPFSAGARAAQRASR